MKLFIYIFLMAGVTYLIRMLPLVLCRKEIESPFLKSFLFYIPYSVLGAMTFPAIFSSTQHLPSAIAGTCAALLMAYKEKSLIAVAAAACVATFLMNAVLF